MSKAEGRGPALGIWKRFKIRRACRALAFMSHQGLARNEDIASACGMLRATTRFILHELLVYGYATEESKDTWAITPSGRDFMLRWSSLIAKDV